MSQHDIVLDNQTRTEFRADLNSALAAIASCQSGATEPANPVGGQFWLDTTSGFLKQRNAANNAWGVIPLQFADDGTANGDETLPVNKKLLTDLLAANALAANTKAEDIAQGVPNAMKIWGRAGFDPRYSSGTHGDFPVRTVSAGNVNCNIGNGSSSGNSNTSSTSWQTAHTFTMRFFKGTLRFKGRHRITTTTGVDSDLRIQKNGSTVNSWSTGSQNLQTRTQDISVSVGDVVRFQHKTDSSASGRSIFELSGVGIFASDGFKEQHLYILNSQLGD